MRKNKTITRIINTYFGQNLDPQIQFFNLIVLMGIAAGIVVGVIAVIIKEQLSTIIIDLMISALAFFLLRIAEKKKCYKLCSWIIVIVIFMIAFPALFFFCGGRSGVSCFFVLAIFYTAHMLEKHERVGAVTLEFIIYIACCFSIFYKPEWFTAFLVEHTYIIDVTINFTVSALMLLTAVMLRDRMINIRQMQMQELNRELESRNETLMRYDRMKSDFLGTIAHEINTPLAVIAASSYDTLDLLKTSPLNMNEIIENQVIIGKRVKLIDNIIMDLMDTVAIENGRLSLSRQPMKLSELLKNLCDAQFKRLDKNNNRITYDFQPDLPYIWADPQRIEQVMINLLSNATQHTESGMITVKLTRTDKNQIVGVTDTGEGMDMEMARIALKQYVSTKADYWRHGIGLYICRQIITAHGGDIWIDSEKGRGTSVFFSLREESDYE